jgi:hypothetical protein
MTASESEKAIKIRRRVLEYFQPPANPTALVSVLEDVRGELPDVTDSDIRDVVLRLISTGRLMYSPDMRISLGE